MNKPELYNEDLGATYCPEDNKIRLYVGRVPHKEYLALKSEGWKSTPKQDCDFVAVWTPRREDTALSYAGFIGDEDQSPTDRAADRAERFTGYLEKRRSEAGSSADSYDSGPQVFGHQDKGRAARAANRHDRHASRACNAWSKAEYWERRTRGVIDSALYKSRPDVRFGRIKKLESEQRKGEKVAKEYALLWKRMADVSAEKISSELAEKFFGCCHASLRIDGNSFPVYSIVSHEGGPLYCHYGKDRGERVEVGVMSPQQIAKAWITQSMEPGDPDSHNQRNLAHLSNRLAYENQMLEAQGGTAGLLEIEPGGKFGGHLIWRVNKSPITTRPISVQVKGTTTGFSARSGYKKQETWEVLHNIEIDRYPQNTYKAPTPESLAELKEAKAAWKKANAKPKAPKLLNPTDEDAERLQLIWNERAADEHTTRKRFGEPEQMQIIRTTQARYSANSKGNYASCETRELCRDAKPLDRYSNCWSSAGEKRRKALGPVVCKVRISDRGGLYAPPSIIILTDKPQKKLPAEVWETYEPEPEKPEAIATEQTEMVLS